VDRELQVSAKFCGGKRPDGREQQSSGGGRAGMGRAADFTILVGWDIIGKVDCAVLRQVAGKGWTEGDYRVAVSVAQSAPLGFVR